jgi:hypothetical protein
MIQIIARMFAVLGVSCAAAQPAAPYAAEKEISDFAVKAAYLSKFGGFIRWPDEMFSSETSPLTICVIGESPVGGALNKVAGRAVGKRPIAILSLTQFSADAGCHILYAGDTDAARVSDILKSAQGAKVLTVTDLAAPPATPAVINFVMKENHVRFEIDEQAASDNGLMISSQLLGLAVSVKTRG